MASKSCFSSSTISGIVVLTVLATICSVALLLYLLFGLKQGRNRYGNRLLKKLALHNYIPNPPPPPRLQSSDSVASACNPLNDKTINGKESIGSIRRPERKLRSLPNSPPPVCPYTRPEKNKNKGDGVEEADFSPPNAAEVPPSPDSQQTFTIRATDLDLFDLRLENSRSGSELCLVPKMTSTLNEGQLKLLSVSLEGLEFPTIERVLEAARGALLVCTSHPSNGQISRVSAPPFCLSPSLPPPTPSEHCVVEMEPLDVDETNLELLRVDCSAQVTPRSQENVGQSCEPDTVSIAIQVGEERAESQLYHTAYGSDDSDVSDAEEPIAPSPPNKEEANDHLTKRTVFDLPIFYRHINVGQEIAMATRPEEVIKKGLSRSVPNLQEVLSASAEPNAKVENVQLYLEDGTNEHLMQALNVQEILDFIDNMNQHLTVAGNSSDSAQLAGDHQMDDEQWEQAIYATLKPTVIESEEAELTEEHQQKLSYFQEQFKQQCEELEQLGVSVKPSIPQVKV